MAVQKQWTVSMIENIIEDTITAWASLVTGPENGVVSTRFRVQGDRGHLQPRNKPVSIQYKPEKVKEEAYGDEYQ
jgi:hypothetical protein